MVEEVAIGEIRRMQRRPEVAARTARAVRKERPDPDEPTVIAALGPLQALVQATFLPKAKALLADRG